MQNSIPPCVPIRTRAKKVSFSPLEEILWNRAQDRETSFIAAQESAKVKAQQIAEILAQYDFSRDEWNSLKDAQGTVIQLAMRVVSKTDVNDRYLVVAKNGEQGIEYDVYLPRHYQPGIGNLMISAVQARIEANRARRKAN